MTARDLNIDLAYLLILQRSKEPKDSDALQKQMAGSFKALVQGSQAMITSSGETLFAQSAGREIWSNTEEDIPVFDLTGDNCDGCTLDCERDGS